MSTYEISQFNSDPLTGPELEARIAALLECRFGDGLVYMPRHRPAELYEMAQQRGYIDTEGFLTRKGRTLLAQHG